MLDLRLPTIGGIYFITFSRDPVCVVAHVGRNFLYGAELNAMAHLGSPGRDRPRKLDGDGPGGAAGSSGDIFQDNCERNDVLAISLPDDEVEGLAMQLSDVTGHRLTVDLAAQTITVASSGLTFGFAVDALQKDLLLQCIDMMSSTLSDAGPIEAFERGYRSAHRRLLGTCVILGGVMALRLGWQQSRSFSIPPQANPTGFDHGEPLVSAAATARECNPRQTESERASVPGSGTQFTIWSLDARNRPNLLKNGIREARRSCQLLQPSR